MAEWWKNEFYSQFGEDSVLHSYYRNMGYARSGLLDDIAEGFFVDIGSHHPYMLSNSWHFYQRGWRGINVDPTPGVREEFDALRPRDINLQIAIASRDGEATFYSYGRSVSNTLDASRVDSKKNPDKIMVKTLRLSTLLDLYLPLEQQISFLSVDVEGVDLDVLRSNDWSRYRPELVVVEHHESAINNIISSDLYKEMLVWGYRLYAWTPPSLIFRR